jgi:carbonic anhydrase
MFQTKFCWLDDQISRFGLDKSQFSRSDRAFGNNYFKFDSTEISMSLVKKYCLGIVAILMIALCAAPLPSFAKVLTPDWSYQGATNPRNWSKIARNFATCEIGKDQSPINLTGTVTGTSAQMAFNYQASPLAVTNNGHSIQVNYAPGSTIEIDGAAYQLLQFHFHTPSEHQIAGKVAAMELHLVHRNTAGKLAVVGVMMAEGKENPEIAKIWNAIPPSRNTNPIGDTNFNAVNLLPAHKSYYSYAGSLTTPPCSEGVNWTILAEPITVSTAQLNKFKQFYPANARPIQLTNTRKIELHQTF